MAPDDEMKELLTLIPGSEELEAGGEKVTVASFKVRQIPKVLTPLKSLGKYVNGDDLDFDGLLTEGLEHLAAVVGAAVDRPAEWVLDLSLSDLVRLATAVLEANKDFFSQAAPLLKSLGGAVAASAGRTSSRH